jgi:hypothetical protein
MKIDYADHLTLADARALYFETNDFGADGGYGDAWVEFELGPIKMPFPNTPGRVRAVKFHDLHHILTGYDTNPVGEFEIAGWELGAGARKMPAAARVINASGFFTGLLSSPRKVVAAFLRGRRSRSLYPEDFEPLLRETVAEARARYLDVRTEGRPWADALAMAAWIVAGSLAFPLFLVLTLPLAPLGLVLLWLRKARHERAQAPAPSR